MNFSVFSEPKMGFKFRQNRKSDHSVSTVLNVRQNVSEKASAEGNADVLEGFQEESGNEIDDDDSSDKEIPSPWVGLKNMVKFPGGSIFSSGGRRILQTTMITAIPTANPSQVIISP